VAPGSGAVNFLRAGIVNADALTTVSPTHAREIQTAEYGKGMEELLRQRRHRLAGILNGVDYAQWSPESDTYLAAPYSAAQPQGKLATRAAMLATLGLDVAAAVPVVGLVSRLAEQKGIDLAIEALPELLRARAFACVILGSGDQDLADALAALAAAFPGRVAHRDAHDEPLAHRILAGSDLLLVPSRYEPCGNRWPCGHGDPL
jgi:starch synthase